MCATHLFFLRVREQRLRNHAVAVVAHAKLRAAESTRLVYVPQ